MIPCALRIEVDNLRSTCGQAMLLTALALPSSNWPFCFNTCASLLRRPLRPLHRYTDWREGAFGLSSLLPLFGALHSSFLHCSLVSQLQRIGTHSWRANAWAGEPRIRTSSSRCGRRMPRLTCSSMSSSCSYRCPSLGCCGLRARAEWDSLLSLPWAGCKYLRQVVYAFANAIPASL